MSTQEGVAPGTAIPAPVAARRPAPPRLKLRDTWWRHVVGIIAVVVSLFPVVFIISASFNRADSVSGTSILPTHFTIDNYSGILHESRTRQEPSRLRRRAVPALVPELAADRRESPRSSR